MPAEVGTDFLATAAGDATDLQVIADCDYECHHREGQWSPDGQHLIFTQEFDQSPRQLVIVDADGSDPTILLEGAISSPTWSPDGRRIAFIKWRFPKTADDWVSDVFVVNRDGSGRARITSTPEWKDDLDWSDNGLLVFRRTDERADEKAYQIWTMRPDGAQPRRLTAGGQADADPVWAPGGEAIAFVRDGAVWTMSATGAHATRLASGHSPAWAPDGSVIAYVGANDGAIHTMSPAGANDVRLGSPVTQGLISDLDWQPMPIG